MHGAPNHCGEQCQKDAVLVSELTRFRVEERSIHVKKYVVSKISCRIVAAVA